MPYTTLRLEDLARVDEIKTFLIDDLWNKRFEQATALSLSEQSAVDEVGRLLFGSDLLFDEFKDETTDFSYEDQQLIDES